MSLISKITFLLGAGTAGFDKDIKNSEGVLTHFADNAESQIKKLRESFGKKSLAGELFHIAQGGGAVAAITEGTKAVEEMANKVADFRKQMALGETSTRDMVEGLVKSIPVLGGMVTAWQAVGEAITGAKAAEESSDAALTATNARLDGQLKLIKEIKGINTDIAAIQVKAARELQGSTLTGEAKKDFDRETHTQEQIAEVNKVFEAKKEAYRKDAAEQEKLLRTEAEKYQQAALLSKDPHDTDIDNNMARAQLDKIKALHEQTAREIASIDEAGAKVATEKEISIYNEANAERYEEAAKAAEEAHKKEAEQYAEYTKSMYEKASRIIEANETPLEKAKEQMEEINTLAERGFLTAEQKAKAILAIQKTIAKDTSKEDKADSKIAIVERRFAAGAGATATDHAKQTAANTAKLVQLQLRQAKSNLILAVAGLGH